MNDFVKKEGIGNRSIRVRYQSIPTACIYLKVLPLLYLLTFKYTT